MHKLIFQEILHIYSKENFNDLDLNYLFMVQRKYLKITRKFEIIYI